MTQPASLSVGISQLDLERLNLQFEHSHPKKILAWCTLNFPTGLIQTSNFNVDDLIITDILYRELRPTSPVPVLFVDTLHHFAETLNLVKEVKKAYNLDLKVYKIPGIRYRQGFAKKYGEELWRKDQQRFHQLTQINPFNRGLRELGTSAIITSRRRDQIWSNTDVPIFERDVQGLLKVNPLVNWTRAESWAYVYEYDLIYNPLHDQGYATIGDEPLTPKPVTHTYW